MLSILAYLSSIISATLGMIAIRGKTTETIQEERTKEVPGGTVHEIVEREVLTRKGKWTIGLLVATLSVSVITQYLKDEEDRKKDKDRNALLVQQLQLSNAAIKETRRARTELEKITIDFTFTNGAKPIQPKPGSPQIPLAFYMDDCKLCDITVSAGSFHFSDSNRTFPVVGHAVNGLADSSYSSPDVRPNGDALSMEDVKGRIFSGTYTLETPPKGRYSNQQKFPDKLHDITLSHWGEKLVGRVTSLKSEPSGKTKTTYRFEGVFDKQFSYQAAVLRPILRVLK